MRSGGQKLELVRRHFENNASPAEHASLQELLRADAVFRRFFVRYASLDAALGEWRMQPAAPAPETVVRTVWFGWRAAAVAAVSVALGMLCAWIVLDGIGREGSRVMATTSPVSGLVDGGFEAMLGRIPSGFPVRPGVWSGDHCVVEIPEGEGAHRGRVLRFVRAESDPAAPERPASSCDVFQIVDLRPLQKESSRQESTLELSARFLDARPLPGPALRFDCRVHVFSGTPEELLPEWPLTRTGALAYGCGTASSAGGDPEQWCSVAARVLLPREAEFAVIQLVATHLGNRKQAAEFSAQFVDDVRLSVKKQPLLPVRLAGR